jgi:hypothetical protein
MTKLRVPSPLQLLKSCICGHCGGIRLPQQKCLDCLETAKIRRLHPELFQTNNWSLRPTVSKRRFHLCRKKRHLQIQLEKVQFKLNSVLHKRDIEKLLDKQNRIIAKLQIVKQELEAMRKPPKEKPKDKREVVLQCLQSITDYGQRLADDEKRYAGL